MQMRKVRTIVLTGGEVTVRIPVRWVSTPLFCS
jgi:hypothetical protein